MPMDRRNFLKTGLAAPALGAFRLDAAERSYLADAPDMLVAHVTGRLNALAAKWDEERTRIHTAAEVEARNRFRARETSRDAGRLPRAEPARMPWWCAPTSARAIESRT